MVSSVVAARARAIAPATAWVDSGAGMRPSARANSTPALKASAWSTAMAVISPRFTACETIGAIPW